MSSSAELAALIALLGLSAGGGGVVIPLLSQLAKKLFGLQSGAVIHTMVIAFEVLQVGALYLLQFHAQLPLITPVIGFLVTHGASQFVYKYAGYGKDIASRVQFSLAPAPAAVPSVPAIEATPAAIPSAAPAEPAQSTQPANPANQEFNA